MSPPARADAGSRVDFVCMCLCMIQHLLLVAFEVLCCYKLEFINEETPGEDISWCFVFTPLFIQSLFAMLVSVYCVRHDKSFEFGMFFAINVVQFVFIAFKLNNALQRTIASRIGSSDAVESTHTFRLCLYLEDKSAEELLKLREQLADVQKELDDTKASQTEAEEELIKTRNELKAMELQNVELHEKKL
ncbi:hypothetical protein M3Y96_00900100 [Aphelenchoides besseyi]|nr:hypothetical protein M3Y96_00900100 [Aphelenchoides besseyi]